MIGSKFTPPRSELRQRIMLILAQTTSRKTKTNRKLIYLQTLLSMIHFEILRVLIGLLH